MLVFICTQYAPSCSDDKKMHWHLGDPLPASLPWEPNSEALASLTGAQWNPCVHAYFGCISMFLIFSLETVSHTHGASVWSVILSPAIASVSLLPGGRAGSMTQLREMIQMWLLSDVSKESLCAVPMRGTGYDSLHLEQWSGYEH